MTASSGEHSPPNSLPRNAPSWPRREVLKCAGSRVLTIGLGLISREAKQACLPRGGASLAHSHRVGSRRNGSQCHTFAHGQGSASTRCIAAWMSCCDSESLTQTTLKRDLLPPCSTQSKSPGRTCLVMPESKPPFALTLVAIASCANG
jgi:hypothetical protein